MFSCTGNHNNSTLNEKKALIIIRFIAHQNSTKKKWDVSSLRKLFMLMWRADEWELCATYTNERKVFFFIKKGNEKLLSSEIYLNKLVE